MKSFYFIIIFLGSYTTLLSQDCKNGLLRDYNGNINFNTQLYSGVFLQSNCDTVKIFKETIFDSTFFHRTKKYVTISNEGKLILEGNKASKSGYCGGCGPFKIGLWNEYYRNGKLKSTGKYICDAKIGEWKYFYESGSIHKIENYANIDWETVEQCDSLKWYYFRGTVLSGPYIEYHENGFAKMRGNYKISFVIDSIFSYSENISVTDFPTPNTIGIVSKSKKSGTWLYYNNKGEFISEENCD